MSYERIRTGVKKITHAELAEDELPKRSRPADPGLEILAV